MARLVNRDEGATRLASWRVRIGQRVKCDMKTGQLLYLPDESLEEEQENIEEVSNEECYPSSEEDEEFDDDSDMLNVGLDLCSVGLEPVKNQPNVAVEKLMVMLSPDLIKEEKEQYLKLFGKYPKLFATEYIQMRGTHSILHEIKLNSDSKPVSQKLRRLGNIRKEILEEEVNKLLAAGFIHRVDDVDWVSPVVMVVIVPKKNGKWSICGFWTFKCGNQETSFSNAFSR